MVKRYDPVESDDDFGYLGSMYEDENGDYVLFDDYELLKKDWGMERNEFIAQIREQNRIIEEYNEYIETLRQELAHKEN